MRIEYGSSKIEYSSASVAFMNRAGTNPDSCKVFRREPNLLITQRRTYAPMTINLPPKERCFSKNAGNPPQFQHYGFPIIRCNEVDF